MRILLAIKNFDFGGSENHVCELANALDQRGHEVFVLGKKGRQVQRLNPTVVYIACRLYSWLFPVNLIQVVRIVRKHRIELIHAHQRYAIHLGSLAGMLTRTPVVLTVHGRSQYDLRSWLARRISRKIIFVSEYVMRHAVRFPEIQHKTVLISNGIRPSSLNNSRKPNHLCYVSRIDKRHSETLLLMITEVLPKLLMLQPDIVFHVVGEGKLLPKVLQQARQLNAHANREVCLFHGYHPEVKALLQESALVMGVGRVALEALSSGTPVLSVNRKRMGALLSTKNYTFYKTNNFVAVGHPAPTAEKLLAQFKEFLDRPGFWLEEAIKLQKRISEDFSYEKTTEDILHVYRGALKTS